MMGNENEFMSLNFYLFVWWSRLFEMNEKEQEEEVFGFVMNKKNGSFV